MIRMTPTITIWPGCDLLLTNALTVFSQTWGPYSMQSRRYPIFKLLQELIDPAWQSLCEKHPDLSIERLDAAWTDFQWEQLRCLAPDNIDNENKEEKIARWKKAFTPCAGKNNNKYVISALAKGHGFNFAEKFLRKIGRYTNAEVSGSIDSMSSLMHACQVKQPKSTKVYGKVVNIRRIKDICMVCGKMPEAAQYLMKNGQLAKDHIKNRGEDRQGRNSISNLYCSDHRPKDHTGNVRSEYLIAKRNQDTFNKELYRLDRQCWGDSSISHAKSGNKLVDEYIRQFIARRCLSLVQQVPDNIDLLEFRLREEARLLTRYRINDRKKEIVVLLSLGLNQSQVALQLGVTRQSISKTLQSVKAEYRLDLPMENKIR